MKKVKLNNGVEMPIFGLDNGHSLIYDDMDVNEALGMIEYTFDN